MKSIITTSVILLAFGTGQAMADCTTTPVKGQDLVDLISDSLVCGRPGTNYLVPPGEASDRWQEEHISDGTLYDYKLGPGHAVDPRKPVGKWSIGLDQVTHSYTDGGSYSWGVYKNSDDTHSFCEGSAERVRAFIKQPNPGSGCGSFPP